MNHQVVLTTPEEAKTKLQAAILWLLRDWKWHSLLELWLPLNLCIQDEEALAYRRLWLAAEGRSGDEDEFLEVETCRGQTQLIVAAVEGLIAAGLCKSRGTNNNRELQRVRLDQQTRTDVRTMEAMEEEAKVMVMGRMGAGKIVQVQGVLWDIVNLFPSPVDPYLAIPVATSLAQWLRDEWEEAPVQEEEAQDEPVQAGVDTQQRDPVKPDRKPDESSWL